MLAHSSRQPTPWLIYNVRQKIKAIYTESEAVAAIEAKMKQMLSGVAEPYGAGWGIWEIAFAHASDSPRVMTPLWLVWGALTDWVEVKPHEAARAKEEMMRASREWFALERGDEKARDAYFDRWIYDELGIERKEPNQPPEPTRPFGPSGSS